jgi:hypothetical protein
MFFDKAINYSFGILRSYIHNILRISEGLKFNYNQMQYFIMDSNFDARALIFKLSNDLAKRKLIGSIIDENCWAKKGEKSIVFELFDSISEIILSQFFHRKILLFSIGPKISKLK